MPAQSAMAAAILVLAAALAPALAQAPVRWASLPDEADMKAAYPARAAADSLGGKATLRCDVRPDGGLAGCLAISETPTDYGFGPAALILAAKIRVVVGPDMPATVTVPIQFKLPPRELVATFPKVDRNYADFGPAGPYYPMIAIERRLGGYAVLACDLAGDGGLSGCTVAEEAPADVGFGEAALRMAEKRYIVGEPRPGSAAGSSEQVRVLVPFGKPRK